MATIKVSNEILYQIIQEKLLLPNPVTEVISIDYYTYKISTELSGFDKDAEALPIYHRDYGSDKVTLIRIESVP